MSDQLPWGPPPRDARRELLVTVGCTGLVILTIMGVIPFACMLLGIVGFLVWFSVLRARFVRSYNERRAVEWSQAATPPPYPYASRANKGWSAGAIVLSVIAAIGGLAVMGFVLLVVIVMSSSSFKLFPNK